MESGNSFASSISNFKTHLTTLGRANATILAYTKDIEQLGNFLKENLKTASINEVKTENINSFKEHLTKKGYTAKSISRKINSIKSFFNFLQSQAIIKNNPALTVTHPKYEVKPPRILSKLEYRALRDACKEDSRIFAIVEILLQTGIRISELANLRINDVNLTENKTIIIAHESHPERTIPFNQASKEALEKYLKDRPKSETQTIFITKTGNPFLIRNIRSSLDRYFKLADIENVKVNDLRHTFIAHQLTAGSPLVYISKLVGHKRLSTTEKYLEFIPNKPTKDKPQLSEL
ncbi:tyrosine-type recombinase/integrase [Patescibacteria group bacterium]|nr:tyrosine-type recombinase/integrase [Patescibacteria group bacterium]